MLILSTRNLPELEVALDCMREQARGLVRRHPAINGCRMDLRDAAPAGFEARIALRLAQGEVVVSAHADAPRQALAAAVIEVDENLARRLVSARSLPSSDRPAAP